ncbi:UDP-glucose/GDP-mannose dehydrogenase family protein [Candidatus Fermentibacterales bacterium]|nr:UDP-glucose/GDP-mannose dehydrogenase family protein [Candidatus Fermentibacterales bacterium]
MHIAVIGSGYVGLVAAACLAEMGNDVISVDKDENKIADLRKGIVPIYEPGLDRMIERNVRENRLGFSTDVPASVRASRIIFIAVGTPQGEDGSADLQHVRAVAAEIGKAMDGPRIVVNKSTVPVGTADRVREEIGKHTNHRADVVSNPEFLKEGSAIDDFMKPDRVVIGTDSPEVADVMTELYSPFVRTNNPIIVMGNRSAEMTKYVSNCLLAARITFMNEVANLCDIIGADVKDVRMGVGSDRRIGPSFLFPGIGYGGSCFPKDVRALIATSDQHGYRMSILRSVVDVNEAQKRVLVDKAIRHFEGDVSGRRFGLWGLSFKPNTDDMREAPSLVMIRELLEKGAVIRAFDPVAMSNTKAILGDAIEYADSNYEALEGADALMVATEWAEFREPDFERIRSLMRQPVVFDGRNVFNPSKLKQLGFTYYGVGRQ